MYGHVYKKQFIECNRSSNCHKAMLLEPQPKVAGLTQPDINSYSYFNENNNNFNSYCYLCFVFCKTYFK